jgi:GGDEF domain-containing protein
VPADQVGERRIPWSGDLPSGLLEGGVDARHDPLTGLPNRALLIERVADALVAREHLPERSRDVVALLTCGCHGAGRHDPGSGTDAETGTGGGVGDEVLAAVAGRLLRVVRATDCVGWLGTDQFAVLCTDMYAPSGAEVVADRLLAALALPYELDDAVLCLTVSVGVSVAAPSTTPRLLLGEADSAMAAARRAGGDRFTWYEHGEPGRSRLPQHAASTPLAPVSLADRRTEDRPGV